MPQVLVVADDTSDARGWVGGIEGVGAEVLIAPDHAAAGHLAAHHRPCVCLVDLRNIGDRLRAVDDVRRRSPGTSVVALVDELVAGEIFRLDAAGASVLLPRAAPPSQLGDAVARLLGSSGGDRDTTATTGRQLSNATGAIDGVDAPLRRAIARSPLFRLLTPQQIAELLEIARERTCVPGTELLSQGARSEQLTMLVDGQAKCSHMSADGREVILSVLGPGDPVGVAELLSDTPAQVTVTTLEEVRALVLPADELRRLRRTSPAMVAVLAHTAGVLLQRTTAQAIEWMTTDISDRVARRIVHLADHFGEPAADGTIDVPLPLTQEGLAAWAGLSRETIVRELADLRADGLIRTGRCRMVVLDLERLRARRERRRAAHVT